jgi:protein TonB
LKDLTLIIVQPEVVPAPKPPDDERTLETSDPSLVRKGGKVESVRLLKQVLPVYPSLARNARVQGSVILEVTVGTSGKVEEVNVVEGHPMLIAAAVDAVRQWRYEPAKLNDVPTSSSVRITVVFRLEFPR